MGAIYKNNKPYCGVDTGVSSIDKTLTETGKAAESKAVGDKFNDKVDFYTDKFSNHINYNHLKYDPSTDKVYVDTSIVTSDESNWVEWKSVGLKQIWIFNDELENPYLMGVYDYYNYNDDYTSNSDTTFDDQNRLICSNNLTVTSARTNDSFGTSNAIDLAPYTWLRAEVEYYTADNTANRYTYPINLDISDVNGNCYVGIMLRKGPSSSFLYAFVSGSESLNSYIESAIASISVFSTTNTSSTDSTNVKNYAIVKKLWLE